MPWVKWRKWFFSLIDNESSAWTIERDLYVHEEKLFWSFKWMFPWYITCYSNDYEKKLSRCINIWYITPQTCKFKFNFYILQRKKVLCFAWRFIYGVVWSFASTMVSSRVFLKHGTNANVHKWWREEVQLNLRVQKSQGVIMKNKIWAFSCWDSRHQRTPAFMLHLPPSHRENLGSPWLHHPHLRLTCSLSTSQPNKPKERSQDLLDFFSLWPRRRRRPQSPTSQGHFHLFRVP